MDSSREGLATPSGPAAPPRTPPPRHRSVRAGTLGAIAVGGALGATARVALERVVPTGPGLAWGTFLVNVVGTFVLAGAAVIVLERLGPTRLVWPMLATGVCGSFTTFSTLVVEVDLRLRSGDIAPGIGYGAASVTAGLVAVVAGTVLARGLLRRDAVRGHGADTTRRRRQWS